MDGKLGEAENQLCELESVKKDLHNELEKSNDYTATTIKTIDPEFRQADLEVREKVRLKIL